MLPYINARLQTSTNKKGWITSLDNLTICFNLKDLGNQIHIKTPVKAFFDKMFPFSIFSV